MMKDIIIASKNIMQVFDDIFDPLRIMLMAKASGFTKRIRKIYARDFLLDMVLPNTGEKRPSYTQMAARKEIMWAGGESVSAPAICKRMTRETQKFLGMVFQYVLTRFVADAEGCRDEMQMPEYLKKFTEVNAFDSSTIELKGAAAQVFPGPGGAASEAAVKVHIGVNILDGGLKSLRIGDGITPDGITEQEMEVIRPCSLNLVDAGYIQKKGFMHSLHEAGSWFLGKFWLLKTLYEREGGQVDLEKILRKKKMNPSDSLELSFEVEDGGQRIPVRLLVTMLPESVAAEVRRKKRRDAQKKGRTMSERASFFYGYHILITSTTAQQLTPEQAIRLYPLRWQIELSIKRMKSFLGMRKLPYTKPESIHCHLLATAIAYLLQSFLYLTAVVTYRKGSREPSFYKMTSLFAFFTPFIYFYLRFYYSGIDALLVLCVASILKWGLMEKRKTLSSRERAVALS